VAVAGCPAWRIAYGRSAAPAKPARRPRAAGGSARACRPGRHPRSPRFGGTLFFVIVAGQAVLAARLFWREGQLRLFGEETSALLIDKTRARSASRSACSGTPGAGRCR
jgi:hypothetical protein